MKSIALTCFTALTTVLIATTSFAQTSYYVNQKDGSNDNDGQSVANAFAEIDNSVTDKLTGGDTLFIVGEYKNPSYNADYEYNNPGDAHLWHAENTIRLGNLEGDAPANGESAKYITIKGYDENTKLIGDGGNIFRVQNCKYLIIEDLIIEGEKEIPLEVANALQFVYIDANTTVDETAPLLSDIKYRNEDCISNCVADTVVEGEIYTDLGSMEVRRPTYIDTRGMYLSGVENIIIRNNKISYMPGGGMRVSDCEDVDIIGNEVSYSSRRSYTGTHGLVVTKATSSRAGDDYRIRILRNKVHHNFNEQYSWSPSKVVITPVIDEGKGISLQRNETAYENDGTIKVNWENGRILVQNNLCYFNGFSGLHSNDGNRIDFINNTSYYNSYTKSITEDITTSNGGNIGISAQGGSDIRILNNISVIDSDLSKSAISSNLTATDGLVVKDNIIYGTDGPITEQTNVKLVAENMQMVDPLFVDPANFDFSLQANSTAKDPTTALQNAPSVDFFNNPRDASPDLGAIEFIEVSGVNDLQDLSLDIYPNPVTDVVTISDLTFSQEDIRLYNSAGKELSQLVTTTGSDIDVSVLPKGIYVLKIGDFTGKVFKL